MTYTLLAKLIMLRCNGAVLVCWLLCYWRKATKWNTFVAVAFDVHCNFMNEFFFWCTAIDMNYLKQSVADW